MLCRQRRAMMSTYIHHFLLIFIYLANQINPEEAFHYIEYLLFVMYESTNIPLNIIYLMRHFKLSETRMYFCVKMVFAASYLVCRIIIVTIGYIIAFRVWYQHPERGPPFTLHSCIMLSLIGSYYLLISYWGVLIYFKSKREIKEKMQ